MRGFWVYILECADGTLYTGWTTDVCTRVMLHIAGKGAKYTRGKGPFKIVYLEEYTSKRAAMRREAAIKKMRRAQKLQLIEEEKEEEEG
jgi:predicted GIY-YIG superfamily endonuclease